MNLDTNTSSSLEKKTSVCPIVFYVTLGFLELGVPEHLQKCFYLINGTKNWIHIELPNGNKDLLISTVLVTEDIQELWEVTRLCCGHGKHTLEDGSEITYNYYLKEDE